MNKFIASILILVTILTISCEKAEIDQVVSDKIHIDSLTATFYTVKAWDSTLVKCYARGDSLTYSWEADHGNFNGSGTQIKYAAGECCVGLNTITCTISNETGHVSKDIQIEVTSYFGGGK